MPITMVRAGLPLRTWFPVDPAPSVSQRQTLVSDPTPLTPADGKSFYWSNKNFIATTIIVQRIPGNLVRGEERIAEGKAVWYSNSQVFTSVQTARPIMARQADFLLQEFAPQTRKVLGDQMIRATPRVQAVQPEYTPDSGAFLRFRAPFEQIFAPLRRFLVAQPEWTMDAGYIRAYVPAWQYVGRQPPVMAVQQEWTPYAGTVTRQTVPLEQHPQRRAFIAASEYRAPDPGSVFHFVTPLPGVQPVPSQLVIQREWTTDPGKVTVGIVPGFGPPFYRQSPTWRQEEAAPFAGSAFYSVGARVDALLAKAIKAYAAQIGTAFVSAGQLGLGSVSNAQTGTWLPPGQAGE